LKIKLFAGEPNRHRLEEEVNMWIEKHPHIKIQDIKLGFAASTDRWYNVMIIYEEPKE